MKHSLSSIQFLAAAGTSFLGNLLPAGAGLGAGSLLAPKRTKKYPGPGAKSLSPGCCSGSLLRAIRGDGSRS
jgi:hypothetical protein